MKKNTHASEKYNKSILDNGSLTEVSDIEADLIL